MNEVEISKVRYADDKPKDCRYCYFWEGKKKGCLLKEENCYYILPPKEQKKPKSPCDGCPYANPVPCIGYCLRNAMASVADRKSREKEALR